MVKPHPKKMKLYTNIPILCLAFIGCSNNTARHEYDLDQNSFKAETIRQIENESGIKIPDGAKGLRFHYIPPIDPIVFAKIKIPAEAAKLMEAQIAALTDMPDFPHNFANDRCSWWPAEQENVIISKKAFNNGYYLETYFVREKEQIVLYLKYFTI
jgi:hypothetical protein